MVVATGLAGIALVGAEKHMPLKIAHRRYAERENSV
jgi:hypothetical protein